MKTGDKVVAINSSQYGMYIAGDTGTFVRNPGARSGVGIVIILNGRTCEVLRENWQPAAQATAES